MIIPYREFIERIESSCDGLAGSQPFMVPAGKVNIFSLDWVRDEFFPMWAKYKFAYATQQNKPLENNTRRGTCDEIAGRCKSLLIEASRKEMDDADAAGAAAEINILIPANYSLNHIQGPGGHRTLLLGVTEDNETWYPIFFEQQLTHENYKDTTLNDAVDHGVGLFDIWL